MGITDLLLRRIMTALVLGNFRKFKKGNLMSANPCTTQKLRTTLYLVDKTDDSSAGHGISDNSKRCSEEARRGARTYRDFCNKDQVVRTSKDDC